MNIFLDCASRFDAMMRACNRKVLLLLDNFSSDGHPIYLPNLTSTIVQFFPLSIASKLLPIDAGIIASQKRRYRTSQYNLRWMKGSTAFYVFIPSTN